MDTVSVSLEVLGGLLGKTTVELQSALMIDGNDGKKVPVDQSNIDKFVAEALRTRLAEHKLTGKDESISYGKKAAFDDVEKYLIENHGIPKGTDWKTGIANVVTEAKTKAATSDEVVKASEPYKVLVQELQEAKNAHVNTKKDFRDYKINETFQRELDAALADEALGLALPDDQTIRANQVKSFKAFLSSQAKLEPNDKNEIFPVDEKGKPLEDPNFLPLSLKSFISNNAKTFWPTKNGQPDRQAPPAGQQGGQDQQAAPANKFPVFKNAQDLSDFTDKAILEGKDVAYIKEATASFESQPK